MPSAIRIELWCDPCSLQENLTEGEYTPAITIGRMKARRVILCPRHLKEYFTPLHDLLNTELAEMVDPKEEEPVVEEIRRLFYCPIEDCPRHTKGYKGQDTVRNHLMSVHDKTREQARELTNAVDKEPATTLAICPVEGCEMEFAWPAYRRPNQARGVHLAQAHQIMGNQYAPDGKGAKGKRHGAPSKPSPAPEA